MGLSLLSVVASAAAAAGEKVSYTVDGEAYEGYYVTPSAQAPLVLLIHDWDGLTDYEMKRAAMLSELGYAVFAADLYGAGLRPTALADKRACTSRLYEDRARMRKLLFGALEAATAKGAAIDNAVAMGYCFGGTAVLELARAGADLKGFVTFHGGLSTPDGQDYSKIHGKVLILHGGADPNVTIDDFTALARQLEKQGVGRDGPPFPNTPLFWD